MKTIEVNTECLISKLQAIKDKGNKTVRLSIVEGKPEKEIPVHLELDAKNDFRCLFEVKKING